MKQQSLNKLLKAQNSIQTKVGKFDYIKSIGEGGNSYVFHFKKNQKDFAIKFLKPSSSSKTNRFKDEYFCTIQISSHKNLVKYFHFDEVDVSGEAYNIIIMKLYTRSLHSEGCISSLDEKEKSERSWKLFSQIANALSHLHSNGVYHRDIKPQNIFFDEEIEEYVLGDMGIAHFNEDKFAKESKTTPSERMANWGYSAPEQIDSSNPVSAASDIYSLGQLISWYLTSQTVRGVSRSNFSNNQSPEYLKWLDQIAHKSLMSSPRQRFQSISEIAQLVKELKQPPKFDYWEMLNCFDDAIRKSFPRINSIHTTSDQAQISRFFENFQENCSIEDFWFMDLQGGNNTCSGLTKLRENDWLFNKYYELKVNKLIVHRDNHYPYKNFFVILTSPDEAFPVVDGQSNAVIREIPEDWESDLAVYWDDKYIDYRDIQNGYYETDGKVIPVDKSFSERLRYLKDFAYIIIPSGTASAVMIDREPTTRLLKSILSNCGVNEVDLNRYLKDTRGEHSSEITKYL